MNSIWFTIYLTHSNISHTNSYYHFVCEIPPSPRDSILFYAFGRDIKAQNSFCSSQTIETDVQNLKFREDWRKLKKWLRRIFYFYVSIFLYFPCVMGISPCHFYFLVFISCMLRLGQVKWVENPNMKWVTKPKTQVGPNFGQGGKNPKSDQNLSLSLSLFTIVYVLYLSAVSLGLGKL